MYLACWLVAACSERGGILRGMGAVDKRAQAAPQLQATPATRRATRAHADITVVWSSLAFMCVKIYDRAS